MALFGGIPLGGTPGVPHFGGTSTFTLANIAALASKYQGEETFMVDGAMYGQISALSDPRLQVFPNHVELRVQLTADSSKVVNIITMENVIQSPQLLGE